MNQYVEEHSHKLRNSFVLFLVLAMVGWWLYAHLVEIYPFHVQADPEMNFFVDSLNVFKGNLYAFYYHPGTPVEIIGSLLLAVTFPFIEGGIDSLIQYHIDNPQLFLGMARAVIILGCIGTIVIISKYALSIKHWTDELSVTAIAALFFVIHPQAFTLILTWSHNSFNYPLGTLFSLWLLVLA